MGVVIAVVPFLSPTSTGNIDVKADGTGGLKDLGGLTPKAVIIVGGPATDSDTTETADHDAMMGFAVNGGNQNVGRRFCDDNVGTSITRRRWRNDRVISVDNGIEASLNAWITNGITLNFDVVLGTQRRFYAILIAGTDVTAYTDVINAATGTNVTNTTTAPGFRPDLIFFNWFLSTNGSNISTSGALASLGVAERVGSKNMCQCFFEANTNTAASAPTTVIYNDKCMANIINAALDSHGVVSAWGSTGFTIQWTGTTTNDGNFGYLALKLDGVSINVSDFLAETATGNKAYTGIGFLPFFGMHYTTANQANGTINTNDALSGHTSVSAFDGYKARTHSTRNDDSVDPSDNAVLTPDHAYVSGGRTDIRSTRANLVSMDADGYTLNYVAVNGNATTGFRVLIGTPNVTGNADIGTVTMSAPTATFSESFNREADIGTITMTAPEAEGIITPLLRATQMGADVMGLAAADLRATQMGLMGLSKSTALLRATQMGLLVLARGAAGLLVPDPLSLTDGGRSMVIRQRLVNMYSEPTPQGPSQSGRFGRPGLYAATTRGDGPHRAIFTWKYGVRVTVSGEEVYINEFSVGTLPNTDGLPVRWAVSEDECVIVSNSRAYYVTPYDVTLIENENLLNVCDVKFLAGRFIYVLGDRSGQYFYSDVGDALTVSGTSFISAESNPDPIRAAEILGDAVVFFGERTVEFHYATSNGDAPFQRSQGRSYTKGCKSPYSIVLADNTLIFLGSDRKIYRTEAVPLVVSNDDIADRCRKVTDENLPKVTAFTVNFANHEVYVINLPEQGSWAYDFAQKTWAEWRSWTKNRFRVNVADQNVLGDIYSGKLYGLDGQRFDDDGDPLERICSTFAPLRSGAARNFNVALMCKRGVGLATGQGSDPKVEMRFSDNQDSEWSDWLPAPLGVMGDRTRAAIALWIGLGSIIPPGRQFEFRCTDPVEFLPYEVKINEVRP